jgi:hypothetical protein
MPLAELHILMPIQNLEVSNDLLKMDIVPDVYQDTKGLIISEMHY